MNRAKFKPKKDTLKTIAKIAAENDPVEPPKPKATLRTRIKQKGTTGALRASKAVLKKTKPETVCSIDEDGNVNRSRLLKALKSVQPGIDQKSEEGFDIILFKEDCIKTYNTVISITHPLNSKLTCCVKANELYKVLSKMQDDNIRIENNDTELVIKSERTVVKLPLIPDSCIVDNTTNILKDLQAVKWAKLPADFVDGLIACSVSLSTRAEYAYIDGIAIQGENIASSDNYRISMFVMKKSLYDDPIMIPTRAIKDLICFIEANNNDLVIGRFGSWIHFRANSNNVTFSCCLADQEFPWADIKNLLVVSENASEHRLPETLDKAIDTAEIFPHEEDGSEFINLKTSGKNLLVTSSCSKGQVEELVECKELLPEDFDIWVTPKFLKEILQSTHCLFFKKDEPTLVIFTTGKFSHRIIVRDEVDQ